MLRIQEKNAFKTVQLIVPAVNQKTFEKNYLKNEEAYEKLKTYVLDFAAERSDRVVKVYQASLLYFVSGVAEKNKANRKG